MLNGTLSFLQKIFISVADLSVLYYLRYNIKKISKDGTCKFWTYADKSGTSLKHDLRQLNMIVNSVCYGLICKYRT